MINWRQLTCSVVSYLERDHYPGAVHDCLQEFRAAAFKAVWLPAFVGAEFCVWFGFDINFLRFCLFFTGLSWMLWGLKRPMTDWRIRAAFYMRRNEKWLAEARAAKGLR